MFGVKAALSVVTAGIASSLFYTRKNRPQNPAQNGRVGQAAQAALVPVANLPARGRAVGGILNQLGQSASHLAGRLRGNRGVAPAAAEAPVTNAGRLVRSVSRQSTQLVESAAQAVQDPKNRELAALMVGGLGLAGLSYLAAQIPAETGVVPKGMAQQGVAIVNGAVLARIASYVSDQLTEDASRYKRILRTAAYAGLSFVSPFLPLGALAAEAVHNVRQLREKISNDGETIQVSRAQLEAIADEINEKLLEEDAASESDESDDNSVPAQPAPLVNSANIAIQAGKSILGGLGYLLMSHAKKLAVQSGIAAQVGAAAAYIHSSSTLEKLPEVTGALLLATGVVAVNTPNLLIGAVAAGALLNLIEWLTQKA